MQGLTCVPRGGGILTQYGGQPNGIYFTYIIPTNEIQYNTPQKNNTQRRAGILIFLDNQIPKDINQRSGVWLRIHNQHSTSRKKLLLIPATTENYLLTDVIRHCLSNIYNIYWIPGGIKTWYLYYESQHQTLIYFG